MLYLNIGHGDKILTSTYDTTLIGERPQLGPQQVALTASLRPGAQSSRRPTSVAEVGIARGSE